MHPLEDCAFIAYTNGMKNRFMVLLAICCILSAPYTYAKLDEGTVAQQIAQNTSFVETKHFKFMRFFLASNTLPEEPGFWESIFTSYDEQHARALAIYLFNMHISTHAYQQTPKVLSLNYLGVLDGLVRGPKVFEVSRATKFYQDNQKQIDSLLEQFMKRAALKGAAPTQAQLHQWLALLEKQPRRSNKPVYIFPKQNLLKAVVPPGIKAQFKPVLEKVSAQAQKQVVVYDTANVNLEDLDHKIGSHQAHRKRTYRWIKDECYYTSYLTGQFITSQIANRRLPWDTRIYVLTALPQSGEFLIPANGERFKLADGQKSLHWRYHTALLIIVPQGNTYTPIVLDLFLGGQTPLPLDEWITSFNSNTVFSSVPFARDSIVENALKTPQKKEGNSVWVEGTRYEPASVEK